MKHELTETILKNARDAYLRDNSVKPKAFYLGYSPKTGWTCIFSAEDPYELGNAKLWLQSSKAVDLFFSCEPYDARLDLWEDRWNSK